MLLLMLLGLAFPFGNVVGPYFIRCKNLTELRFRRTLTIIGTIIAVVALAMPVVGLVAAFNDADGLIKSADIASSIRWGFILPIGILATIAALWRKTASLN